MDISNRSLALILLVALAVSLFGTFTALNKIQKLGITGAATSDTGTATLNISTTQSITFTTNSVDWGTGGINTTAGYTTCDLYTDGTSNSAGCYGFNTVTQGLVIENNGNQVITNLALRSNVSATQFIGTGAVFEWKLSNNEANSCPGGNLSDTTWTAVSTTDKTICTYFDYVDSQDTLKVDLHVQIPYTASSGIRQAKLTATILS